METKLRAYCLVRVMSRGSPRPVSTLSVIVVPDTVPVYFEVNLPLSPMSRVTSNDTLSPSTLPFVIGVSPPRPEDDPVKVEPSCLKVKLGGPPFPFGFASPFQVPVTSAAKAITVVNANKAHNEISFFILPPCESFECYEL